MIKGCILPWMHMYAAVDGTYHLCCHMYTCVNPMATYKDDISTIFNNEKYKNVRKQFLLGNYNQDCKKACYDIEELGAESNRQQVNKRFKQYERLQDYTNKDGSVNNHPIYLDFRFGNKCNFKCRICGPHSSSTWFKDATKISVFKNFPAQLEDYYTDNDEFWDYLDDIKSSLKYFYFAGGEPLLMDGHYKLLNWLIENNKTDVELTYNTNLSTLTYKNHNVFELWNKFNNISLWPSVDGYKKHCVYSRTNFSWENFEKNLKLVKKYVNTVSCTVSVYSVISTPELIAYLRSQNVSTYLSVLDSPNHFDCRILPVELKNKIIKKYQLLLNKILLNTSEVENIKKTIMYFKKDIEGKERLQKSFKTYNEEVDGLNGTSFVNIYPELKEWYEKI